MSKYSFGPYHISNPPNWANVLFSSYMGSREQYLSSSGDPLPASTVHHFAEKHMQQIILFFLFHHSL